MKTPLSLLGACLVLGLAGCGGAPPAVQAGDLLDAPTTLNLGGTLLSADALPMVGNDVLKVQVKVRAQRSALPAVRLTNVYAVTTDGVWSAALTPVAASKCGGTCALAVGRAPANGIRPGDGVQIVIGMQDQMGRSYLLRNMPDRMR